MNLQKVLKNMNLQRVLNENDDASEEFSITSCKQVTLNGTIGASWTVERAEGILKDGETRSWHTHKSFAQTETAGDVTGTFGYVYRINLGSGNGAAGLTGNVAELRVGISM